MAAYLHCQGIFIIPYLDGWFIHHQVLFRHQSQLLHTQNMVGLRLNKAKPELELVQDIQFLGLRLRLDEGRASLPISKAWEIIAHTCQIFSQKIFVLHRSVPIHGITQLGLRSHPTGSSTLDASTTTFSIH